VLRDKWFKLFTTIASFTIGLTMIITHMLKTLNYHLPSLLENPFTNLVLATIVILDARVFSKG